MRVIENKVCKQLGVDKRDLNHVVVPSRLGGLNVNSLVEIAREQYSSNNGRNLEQKQAIVNEKPKGTAG